MNLQLQKFARDNVELLPGNMELLTDTELTQYYIQTWSLDYNDPGANILQLYIYHYPVSRILHHSHLYFIYDVIMKYIWEQYDVVMK